MDREEILATVPIFSGLDRRHLKRLGSLMVPRSFKAGDEIIKENDQAAGFFVITSGKVDVVRGEGDSAQVLNTLGPGEFFGEMALFEGFPRSATVRCVEDTECLAMTRWDFRAELTGKADVAVAVLEAVVRRLRETDARLTE
jgi:CRP-like cAMP-binding protein